jgi:ABC-type multidrug transport system fused ATPase/permease subunit
MVVMIRIVPIVSNILTQKQGINRSIGPIKAIERLLRDIDKSIYNREKNISNKDLINKINSVKSLRLESVSFNYDDKPDKSLSNVSHVFNKSTMTAIVGPSGGGKTTFVDILSGYRKSTSGGFFVNEINIDKYNPESVMSLVSYVTQIPQIFDGVTIYEHISYGNLNANRRDIINATKLSGAYDFIKNLPQGLDTVLSGSYSSLSGGQKQRIDLSRALLKNSSVLILDEPTGNLDLISEKKLMLTIDNIRRTTEKIIIIIAHRMYTIMGADQIIVLEGGRITGVGNHSELLISNSWYKDAVSNL